MIDFTNTVTIDRTVDEVFAYLADLEHIPDWNWAIECTERLGIGPVGVGATYRQVRHTPSRSVEELRITEFEPDRLLRIEGTLGPFPATVSYALDGDGVSTRIVNHVQLATPGGLRLVAGMLAGKVAGSVAANLATLKERLEA